MPPKVIFTEEKILDAVISLVRREGLEAVTARAIAKELGCTPKPLFTSFQNMDDVMNATVHRAREILEQYMMQNWEGEICFHLIGIRWIQFAMDEPQLYRLIFMHPGSSTPAPSLSSVISNFAGLENWVIDIIRKDFPLDDTTARRLYNQMLLHAHGIACLMVAGQTHFTEEELVDIYTEAGIGLVMYYRSSQPLQDARSIK